MEAPQVLKVDSITQCTELQWRLLSSNAHSMLLLVHAMRTPCRYKWLLMWVLEYQHDMHLQYSSASDYAWHWRWGSRFHSPPSFRGTGSLCNQKWETSKTCPWSLPSVHCGEKNMRRLSSRPRCDPKDGFHFTVPTRFSRFRNLLGTWIKCKTKQKWDTTMLAMTRNICCQV